MNRSILQVQAEEIYRDILQVDASICSLLQQGLIHGTDMALVDDAANKILSALEPIAGLMHPEDVPE